MHTQQRLIMSMEKLLKDFRQEEDRDLIHGEELNKIYNILKANKRTSPTPELEKLLDDISVELKRCKDWSERQRQLTAAKSKKMAMPSVSDCNPFKSRSAPNQHDASKPAAASVEQLLQRTTDMLVDATDEVVTEFYQWTTSYIDEERIFGWSVDATKVADALVGDGEDAEETIKFRAAGIVGIHGSGKTALAQKVFVHDKIKDAFPVRLWVCVGPPEPEVRFSLLYRMLDNLGVDTQTVENIVNNANVVKGKSDGHEKKRSKIGVLLFILHVTLHRTGHPYLIVFDDIRSHDGGDRDPAWYSNLTLPPPPPERNAEWDDRLAYGLPKTRKNAVLVTCRSEDDARAMVRTGRVFRPPKLGTEDGWKLFKREYDEARKKMVDEKEVTEKKNRLYKLLEEMKEEIVGKCLGLPVAIIEAARGFALLEDQNEPPPLLPEPEPEAEAEAKPKAAADEAAPPSSAAESDKSPAHE